MFAGKLYFFLLALCALYTMLRGGPAERLGLNILALCSAITTAIVRKWSGRPDELELSVLIVDLACLAAFAMLAIRTDRYWPIWASALLGLGVLGHIAKWLAGPDVARWVYVFSLTFWSYPIIAIIALGTFNHHRRLIRYGFDPDWSPSRYCTQGDNLSAAVR